MRLPKDQTLSQLVEVAEAACEQVLAQFNDSMEVISDWKLEVAQSHLSDARHST
jgi:hypothetical protein